ncbi:Homocysteine-responsive endoplasmic reticulum-resident ubiquitin-like domain member 2 [Halocaridina rubra]|uniref:Homocysteine-responsive endoplasmic reticulum-resident ubiquitin-like domain member 2 n=1 Tax=Halocaridina rubra TaxID=373956 RepID=A0AAN8ZUG5_HALRR
MQRVAEQRLIYSGQLLVDELKLRSVLRHPTENNSYAIHLVCSPPRVSPGRAPTTSTNSQASAAPQVSSARSSVGRSGDLPTSGSMTVPNADRTGGNGGTNSAAEVSVPSSETNESNDGLRRRGTMSSREEALTATPAGLDAGYPLAGVFQPTTDPIQQMATMQQIYANYVAYVQYMQMGGMGAMPWPQQMFHHVPTGQPSPPMTSTASTTTTVPSTTVEQGDQQQQPDGEANIGGGGAGPNVPAPQPQPQIRMNAQGGEVEDDDENEGMGRDWLDWVYVLSRMIVLLSVVYFYSTISRFMIVVCIALLLYLYQAGWFRPVRRIDNNEDILNVQDPAGNQEEDDRNNNINNNNNNNHVPEGEGLIVENQETGENNVDGDGMEDITERRIGEDELQARQSLLALSWTFLTTFFTSLIPEQPQVI